VKTLVQVADAVVERINTATLPQPATAVRLYQPGWTLDELQQLRVSVVPRSVQVEPATRREANLDCTIDIGIQKKLSGDELQPEIDALTELVEAIADLLRFSHLHLPGGREAAWFGMSNDPVVATEHLEQHRQFTSLLTAIYRVRR
jgi:hypothetical protein